MHTLQIWDMSQPVDTLPSVAELEATMKYDLGKASGGILDDERETITGRETVSFAPSARDLLNISLEIEEGELNKVSEIVVVHFTATELLVNDSRLAYRTFAWHGAKLVPMALHDGSWNFIDLVVQKCPTALLKDELRFMYFDNEDNGDEIYKSLLYIALSQNRLIQARIIIDGWILLLNEVSGSAYEQIYMPGLCLPTEDLMLLSTVSPLEFERLVSSVGTKRSHLMCYGGESTFPLRKPMVDGMQSCWDSESYWPNKFKSLYIKSGDISAAKEARRVDLMNIRKNFNRLSPRDWCIYLNLICKPIFNLIKTSIHMYVLLDVDDEEASRIASETDDLPDKVATAYFSPILHCANEEFVAACIEVCVLGVYCVYVCSMCV